MMNDDIFLANDRDENEKITKNYLLFFGSLEVQKIKFIKKKTPEDNTPLK